MESTAIVRRLGSVAGRAKRLHHHEGSRVRPPRVVLALAALFTLALTTTVVPQASAASASAASAPSRGAASEGVFRPAAVAAMPLTGTYMLENGATNVCLAVNAPANPTSYSNGVTVVQRTCNVGQKNQWWSWDRSTFYFHTYLNQFMCLDEDSNHNVDGDKIQIWSCGSGANQRWSWNDNYSWALQNHWNGKCADADVYNLHDGGPITAWGCVPNKPNQMWYPQQVYP